MKRVVSAEEMQWCDSTAIRTYGLPGSVLMENAGRGAAEVIRRECSPLSTYNILILCGKGNNGGDGFVAARVLLNECKSLTCILLSSPAELKGDAKLHFQILQKIAKKLPGQITIKRFSEKSLPSLPKPDVIVDALFGTGFSGEVRRPYRNLIDWVNMQEAKKIAIDIPSGIHGTDGSMENCAVRAEKTVTFGCLKSGLLCNQGREYSGSIEVIDIGIPAVVTSDKRLQTTLIERPDVQSLLPNRSIHAHKYSVGKVLVLAGSKGLTGAAALCSTAALRAGAGAVQLGTPESVYPILARKLTETMVFPLPETTEGTLGISSFEKIQEKLSWADVLVLGPGCSQNPETQQIILKTILEFRGRILIDADGLNALAHHGIQKLRSSRAQCILTPHVGEFSRLFEMPAAVVERRRIAAARESAQRIGAIVILKGVPTVIASNDGSVILNSTGNPGMATAGSGDVLAGIIAGLWAQGISSTDAAGAGVYLHGLSGDAAARTLGMRSLVAADLIDYFPQAVRMTEEGGNT